MNTKRKKTSRTNLKQNTILNRTINELSAVKQKNWKTKKITYLCRKY